MAQVELVTWLVGIERIDGALRQVQEDITALSRDLREIRSAYELLAATSRERSRLSSGGAALYRLSPAERRVAALAARGESNPRIAAMLHLSVHTVKSHMGSLLRKLGLEHRWQLAQITPPSINEPSAGERPTEGFSELRALRR